MEFQSSPRAAAKRTRLAFESLEERSLLAGVGLASASQQSVPQDRSSENDITELAKHEAVESKLIVLAGDANRDGSFNQVDVLHVLGSGRYLMGLPATWTEGDWNGDGFFDQKDIVFALQTNRYVTGAFSAEGRQWYVQASATAGVGDGSQEKPFTSLASVEQASEPDDTIFVLPSPATVPPLDGGIVLKNGQKLIGVGPDVTGLSTADEMPRLTNTTEGNQGDAVVLAENNEVHNLRILDTQRSAIYGENVGSAIISNNLITSSNQRNSLVTFAIPGVGSETFIGSFGGIHLVADGQGAVSYEITSNVIQDGTFTGISFFHSGSTTATITLSDNRISDLQPPEGADINEAVMLSTDDAAVINATLDGTFIDNLGTARSNSDAIVVLIDGTSQQTVHLENHFQQNTNGVGNDSATGMEVITFGQGNVANIQVRDARFSGLNADGLQNIYAGDGGQLTWQIEDTLIEHGRQNGFRSVTLTPVNTLELRFRNDRFVDIARSGIAVEAYAATDTMAILVESSDLVATTGLSFTGSDGVASHAIDLGGGALGSVGQNRIEARRAISGRMSIQASHNWWGDPTGPPPNTPATVATEPALTVDPRPKPGDADRNGRFDQDDLVQMLEHDKYQTGLAADWTDGDFDEDGVFDQLDIVFALQEGSFLRSSV